jgi:hypothetical protein
MVLADSANEHTVEEWAEIAGVNAPDLYEIAQEFTSHGRKACADIHRGVSQHTNGYYNVQAWNDLNLLIGNYDYAGGYAVGKAYDQNGAKEGQPYNVNKMIQRCDGQVRPHDHPFRQVRDEHDLRRVSGQTPLVSAGDRHLSRDLPVHRRRLSLSGQGCVPVHGVAGLCAARGQHQHRGAQRPGKTAALRHL